VTLRRDLALETHTKARPRGLKSAFAVALVEKIRRISSGRAGNSPLPTKPRRQKWWPFAPVVRPIALC
jgi:hypothetical protein